MKAAIHNKKRRGKDEGKYPNKISRPSIAIKPTPTKKINMESSAIYLQRFQFLNFPDESMPCMMESGLSAMDT
jgi:hypothetical protein